MFIDAVIGVFELILFELGELDESRDVDFALGVSNWPSGDEDGFGDEGMFVHFGVVVVVGDGEGEGDGHEEVGNEVFERGLHCDYIIGLRS